MPFSYSCDNSNLIIQIISIASQLLMQRVQLDAGNKTNDLCNQYDGIRFSFNSNQLQFEERIHISCSKESDEAEAVTLPTEENEDGVNGSIEMEQHDTKNEDNNFLLNSNASRISSNELMADRLRVNYIGGIRRSQLRLRETNNAEEEQVVKLEEGYIGFGYWLFILVAFCVIYRLMLPESRV